MKKRLMIAIILFALALSGCGKGNRENAALTDESIQASAEDSEKGQAGGENADAEEKNDGADMTEEEISRKAEKGGTLTRTDGSMEYVYILPDTSVLTPNGTLCGNFRAEDNAVIGGDGTTVGTVGLIPLSPYRNSRVAVALSERLDSRVGAMYRSMVEYMVLNQGFAESRIKMMNCGLDAALQKNQVGILLNGEPDVIIVAPADVNNVPEITDMCDKRDVPVVYIMSEPEESEEIRWENENIRACYAGPDGIRSGTDQGAIVASLTNHGDINGDGVVKYIMLQGDPNDPTGCERTEHSIRELNESGFETEMILLQRADWEREKAEKVISDALSGVGREAEVIFCGNDEMALGAAEAVRDAGLKDGRDIYIIGAVGNVEAMRAILDGKMTGTVFDDYKAQAEWAGNQAASMIDGDTTERVFYTNPTKITMGNAANMIEYCEG